MTVRSGSGVEPGTDGGGAMVVSPGAVFDGSGAILVWVGAVVDGGGEPFVCGGVVVVAGGAVLRGVRVEPDAGCLGFVESGRGETVKGC